MISGDSLPVSGLDDQRRPTRDQVLFAIHHANDKASVREAARLSRLWLDDNPDDVEILQLSSSLTVTATALLSDATPPYESAAPAAGQVPTEAPAASNDVAPQATGDAQWLTVAEAAQLLGVSDKTIRRRIDAGELPSMLEPLPKGGVRRMVSLRQDGQGEQDTSGKSSGTLQSRWTGQRDINRPISVAHWTSQQDEQDKLSADSDSERDNKSIEPDTEFKAIAGEVHELRGQIEQLRAFIAGGAMQALQERLAALPDAEAMRAMIVENQAQIVSAAVAEAVSQVANAGPTPEQQAQIMAQAVEQGIAAAVEKSEAQERQERESNAELVAAAMAKSVGPVLEELQKVRDDNARLSGELAALREDKEQKGFWARIFGG